MINYSIIIPHYNIPDLLIRCVRSIPERDDVEIIVVDDNSPLGEKYKEIYPDLIRKDIIYIHLGNNIGGGGARNVGLKHATGKWLIFADADDFFNYCINDVLNQYIDSSLDIVFFNANSIDSQTFENTGRSESVNKNIRVFLESGTKEAEYELRYKFGEPWCKIVRHELVKKYQILFEETPIHNDTQFSYLVGYYAKKVGADIRAAYCLTDRKGSVSRVLSPDRYLTRLSVFAKKFAFLQNKNIIIDEWWFIRSSIEYFQNNGLAEYMEKSKAILANAGIDIQDVKSAINAQKKKNKHRVFKMKIIDRVNIEIKKILRFNG